jgi:hypothetical protein
MADMVQYIPSLVKIAAAIAAIFIVKSFPY